jgi:hypothetical protein
MMYVCMYVYMSVSIYLFCIYICMFICLYLSIYFVYIYKAAMSTTCATLDYPVAAVAAQAASV